MKLDKAAIIESICSSLSSGNAEKAVEEAKSKYSFNIPERATRKYSEAEAIVIFIRDGFVDRYSGSKLIFPPVLRILSIQLPREFPFHKNWKMSETHPAYWELYPTLDHIIPVARGGQDNKNNLVCTSMLRNSAKSNWTLEELGWHIYPAGDLEEWDGLLSWFISFAKENPSILEDKYIYGWHKVAIQYVLANQRLQADAAQAPRR